MEESSLHKLIVLDLEFSFLVLGIKEIIFIDTTNHLYPKLTFF